MVYLRLLVTLSLLAAAHAAAINIPRRTEVKEHQVPATWTLRAEKEIQSHLADVTAELTDSAKNNARRSSSSTNLCNDTEVKCDLTNCAACLGADPGYFWLGWCTSTPQTGATGYMGAYWTGDPSNCDEPKTSHSMKVECWRVSDDGKEECTEASVVAGGPGYYQNIEVTRFDYVLPSSMELLDFKTGFTLAGEDILNSIALSVYIFGLSGGYDSIVDGPPSLCQRAVLFEISVGEYSKPSIWKTGVVTYMIYDAAFTYNQADHREGVGQLTSGQTGVAFVHAKGSVVGDATGLVITGDGLDKQVSMQVCSDATAPQVCLISKMGASAFTHRNLNIENSAATVDLFLNNPAYAGNSHDSSGVRVLGVSMAVSGTPRVPDTGNLANEEASTIGAAFFITENKVGTQDSAILPSADIATLAQDSVHKQTQTLGDCGFTTNDWFYSPSQSRGDQGDESKNYANAQEFFNDKGFALMDCMLFSFENTAAHGSYTLWDPILGIDANALSSDSNSESGLKDWAIALIAVSGALVVGGGAVAGVVVYKKTHSAKTHPAADPPPKSDSPANTPAVMPATVPAVVPVVPPLAQHPAVPGASWSPRTKLPPVEKPQSGEHDIIDF